MSSNISTTLSINKSKLSTGLLGALIISIGLIFSEKAIDIPSLTNNNAIIGSSAFLLGWIVFLSTQSTSLIKHGIAILVIAAIGQLYMGWMMEQSEEYRRNNVSYTASFWMIFMVAWISYIYKMSGDNKTKQKYNYIGMASLMISMIGYFFYRNNDWNTLTGGLIPSIAKDNSIFNQFVILFPFGWSLLAIGNAIE
jgi:hypothetical protein